MRSLTRQSMESLVLDHLSLPEVGQDNRPRSTDTSVRSHMVAVAKSDPPLWAVGSAPFSIAQHPPHVPPYTTVTPANFNVIEHDGLAAMLAAALDAFDDDSSAGSLSPAAATDVVGVQPSPRSIVPPSPPELPQHLARRSQQHSWLCPERIDGDESDVHAASIARGSADGLWLASLLQRLVLSTRLILSSQDHWTTVTELEHTGDLVRDVAVPPFRERQHVPAQGMVGKAAINVAPPVLGMDCIMDGMHIPELTACSAVLTVGDTVRAAGPEPVPPTQQWPA